MAEIQKLYEQGLQGATWNQEAHERLLASVSQANASDVAHARGFADEFAGQLAAPFRFVVRQYPKAWPGPAQKRGDCVTHDLKNIALGTVVCEAVSGTPDAVSGKVEQCPKVSPAGEAQGVLSTEVFYWFSGNGNRKSRGEYVEDGWYLAGAVDTARKNAGAVVREPLGDSGIDLTNYDPELAGMFGGKKVPSEVADAIDNHLFREATECRTFEEIRDMLGRGFFVGSDGSEGFSNVRDENGVSRQSGQWSHSMAVIAADDRPEIKRKYGEPLSLILNSWGKWNTGPRRIFGTDIDIPEGAFWARWSDVRRRRFYALSGASGWTRDKLPDYSPGFK